MPDSFFTSSKPRKRKRAGDAGPSNVKKAPRKGAQHNTVTKAFNGVHKAKKRDEELDSDETDGEGGRIDDMELRPPSDDDEVEGDDDADETPAEKRLRLAQLYLDSVKDGLNLADGEFDAAEIDRELISARLKQDVLEHSGKIHLFVADSFDFTKPSTTILRTKTGKSAVTSAIAAESGKYLFTSSKDGSITKWELASGKKLAVIPAQQKVKGRGKAKVSQPEPKGHTDNVLALAVSGDGLYLASGGKDKRLVIWSVESNESVKTFFGPLCHKDSISTLAFRKGTNQLYSGSFDRTVKVYDMSPSVLGYVETLFGHQDNIVALDALRGETCVSVGARDKTVRYWKIVDETQLVFRGGGKSRIREVLEGELADEMDVDEGKKSVMVQKFIEGSLECVAMVDESTFLSGGDSGSISLWQTQKKKPVFTQALCHGFHSVVSATEGVIKTPRWITALGSLRYSDVFASGSWDGEIRLWKLESKLKSFALVGTIPAIGIVNTLQFITPPKEFFEKASWASGDSSNQPGKPKEGRVLLVAAVGREHRLGRWMNIPDGWNRAMVVALSPRS